MRKVDLAVELQILAFYEQRKATLAEVKRGARRAVAEPRSLDYFAIVIQITDRAPRGPSRRTG